MEKDDRAGLIHPVASPVAETLPRLTNERIHAFAEAQAAIRENCGMCDGHGFTIETRTGSTAEHHPSCDGNCGSLCPIEVETQEQAQEPCEYCGRPIAEIEKLITAAIEASTEEKEPAPI